MHFTSIIFVQYRCNPRFTDSNWQKSNKKPRLPYGKENKKTQYLSKPRGNKTLYLFQNCNNKLSNLFMVDQRKCKISRNTLKMNIKGVMIINDLKDGHSPYCRLLWQSGSVCPNSQTAGSQTLIIDRGPLQSLSTCMCTN